MTPTTPPPVVNIAVEGWARLAREGRWSDGQKLAPYVRPGQPVHTEGCDCIACLGRLGVGLAGVAP